MRIGTYIILYYIVEIFFPGIFKIIQLQIIYVRTNLTRQYRR